MTWESTLVAVIVALTIDALVGDPPWLWRRLPHPVVLAGHVIDWLDTAWNRPDRSFATRKVMGIAALGILVTIALLAGLALQWLLAASTAGPIIAGVIGSVFLAQRGLHDHVAAVARALRDDGLDAGRQAVSCIVGRDPEKLDETGVARAAIESLAENFSDAVVAPTFWFALFGLPGLFVYKTVNTADSMIGHRSERHRAFGWGAARLDDLLNLVPARLSAVLVALGSVTFGPAAATRALSCAIADAGKHRSPNAGWPEAAFAGALDIALAGRRDYAHGRVDDAYLNDDGQKPLAAADIARALRLFGAAAIVNALVYVLALAALAIR